MLSIGLRVCWDVEAKKKTERNNAGKLEPGYSAQLDAAASNRHEQEKSIRPTRLLSKGHPPWEGVERIKAKKKVAEEESELEWQFVVFFVRSAASDLEITFILSPIIPSMFIIPDPSLFFTVIQSFHSYCPFQVSNDTKKRERLAKMVLARISGQSLSLVLPADAAISVFPSSPRFTLLCLYSYLKAIRAVTWRSP